MGGDIGGALISFLPLLLVLFLLIPISSLASRHTLQILPSPPPAASLSTSPIDIYLIDCGSENSTTLRDHRVFKSETEASDYVNSDETSTSISDGNLSLTDDDNNITSPRPLFNSAKVFKGESRYVLHSKHKGRHWIRLYFYPTADKNHRYNLREAKFHVTFDEIVLLHDFSIETAKLVYKEYLVTTNKDKITLVFTPVEDSVAFVNAIEVVSAPDSIFPSAISSVAVDQDGKESGKENFQLWDRAFEMSHRLNVGGGTVPPPNDTMFRAWISDKPFVASPPEPKKISISPDDIVFPENHNVTASTAPSMVYATADMLPDAMTMGQVNINSTWRLDVDTNGCYNYLVRLHFCNIKDSNEPIFQNVYINQAMVAKDLYVPKVDTNKPAPMFRDFLVKDSEIKNDTILIQIGPSSQMTNPNVTLNGVEILKISNYLGSLNGYYDASGKYRGPYRLSTVMKILVGLGLVMGVLATGLFILVLWKWKNRPQDWHEKGLSSWLLPLHCMGSTGTPAEPIKKPGNRLESRNTNNASSYKFSQPGLCKLFTLHKLQSATKNFDEKSVIGVGGFGKVYIGTLEDGTKIAIKRANQGSGQGIKEFQTEIELLSKLRHRHLVSLVGYCNEQKEMILVYEYMENGPLRDHLYNSNLPPLSWKQRLEICIGSCRGLHYLHTGATDGVIHRDVKTTNILLDEKFVAKVSDFGLSKVFAPSIDRTHVSTAVKGSFGYLDPEYFRTQQLTDKSDVYSFGVLLFEVLCARPVINASLPMEQVSLAEWAMTNHRKGQLEKLIDPHIAGTILPESLKKYVEAAEKCLAECGIDRPGMGDVLWNLEFALQLQEASKQSVSNMEEINSLNNVTLGQPEEREDLDPTPAYFASAEAEVDIAAIDDDSGLFSKSGKIKGR